MNLAVAVAETSATFTWTTLEPSTSGVSYGRTPAFELGTVTDSTLTGSHSLLLGRLTGQTLYYFRVSSTDPRNNTGYGPDSTFTTPDTSIIQSDDFNAYALKSQWTFVNPRGDAGLSLVGQNTPDAWARIVVPGGIVHQPWTGGNTTPRLMQPANDLDFGVEVKFESGLTQQYQMQGLIIEQDSLNYIRFDVNSDGAGTRVFAGTVINGAGSAFVNTAVAPNGSAPQYLRLVRSGVQWTPMYSFDGVTWTPAGTITQGLTVRSAGLYAGNAGATPPTHVATVDYFFRLGAPVVPEDGTPATGNDPPIISDIRVSPTGTTATVSWTTNEPATSRVSAGPTTAYGTATLLDSTLVTSHSITLRNLDPVSLYHFRVMSADIFGDSTLSSDSTFVTGSASTIVSDDFNLFVLDTLRWKRINPLADAAFSMTGTNTDSARLFIAVPGGVAHQPWTGETLRPRDAGLQ